MPKTLIDFLSEKELDLAAIRAHLSGKNLPQEDPKLPPNDPKLFITEFGDKHQAFDLAVKKNNLMLFKLLLDFDMPIPAGHNLSGLSPEIRALLDSRERWQSKLSEIEPDLHFNRAHEFVYWARKKINISQAPGVLLFGESGHGKTTLVNFQHGVDYRINEFGDFEKDPACVLEELGSRGETTYSQTILPAVYPQVSNLVDMGGVHDTRGPLYDLLIALGVLISTEHLNTVRGFLFVCHECSGIPWADQKFYAYKLVANALGRIINTGDPGVDEDLSDRVLFLATKPSGGLTRDMVHKRLGKFHAEQLQGELVDPDKIAQKRVTDIFVQHPDKILVADVTKASVRKTVTEAMEKFPPARACQDFNFANYHQIFVNYKLKFKCVYDFRYELYKSKKNQENEISRSTQEQELLEGAGTLEERLVKNLSWQNSVAQHLKALNVELEKFDLQSESLQNKIENCGRRITIFEQPRTRVEAVSLAESGQLTATRTVLNQSQDMKILFEQTKVKKELEAKGAEQERTDLLAQKAALGDLDVKDKRKCEERLEEAIKRKETAQVALQEIELQLSVNADYFQKLHDLSQSLKFGFDFMATPQIPEEEIKVNEVPAVAAPFPVAVGIFPPPSPRAVVNGSSAVVLTQ